MKCCVNLPITLLSLFLFLNLELLVPSLYCVGGSYIYALNDLLLYITCTMLSNWFINVVVFPISTITHLRYHLVKIDYQSMPNH